MNGVSFLPALDREMKKVGGSCHGVAHESEIVAEIEAPDRAAFESLVQTFVQAMARHHAGITVVLDENVRTPLNADQQRFADLLSGGPVKLTRKYFDSLPTGVFLASRTFVARHTPVFAEAVASPDGRGEQWRRITASGAAQRLCEVFLHEVQFRRWVVS